MWIFDYKHLLVIVDSSHSFWKSAKSQKLQKNHCLEKPGNLNLKILDADKGILLIMFHSCSVLKRRSDKDYFTKFSLFHDLNIRGKSGTLIFDSL
jgi:hypothetical protein